MKYLSVEGVKTGDNNRKSEDKKHIENVITITKFNINFMISQVWAGSG